MKAAAPTGAPIQGAACDAAEASAARARATAAPYTRATAKYPAHGAARSAFVRATKRTTAAGRSSSIAIRAKRLENRAHPADRMHSTAAAGIAAFAPSSARNASSPTSAWHPCTTAWRFSGSPVSSPNQNAMVTARPPPQHTPATAALAGVCPSTAGAHRPHSNEAYPAATPAATVCRRALKAPTASSISTAHSAGRAAAL